MTRPPKKSESIEIRIPYAAKSAFMQACAKEGRSASEVLREMIERRAAPPRPARRSGHLKWVVAALAALGLAAAAAPSLARPSPEAAFAHIDRNGDGMIDRAEFIAAKPGLLGLSLRP